MAQLIKLQDYVSRYAQDIYLYPARYVRLKKKKWAGLKNKWENPEPQQLPSEGNKQQAVDKANPLFQKIKSLVRQPETTDSEFNMTPMPSEEEQESLMGPQEPEQLGRIKTEEDLKQHFLDQLLPFQLKWASSTLTEKSFIAREYTTDATLKFLLQRFPDTFLILYKPIFLLKKAPVEAEIIMITPAAAICIAICEAENDSVFVGSKDRFWVKKTKDQQMKILNPLIALDRTESIVKSLFDLHDVELPVQKLLMSRNGYFDYPQPPYGVHFIEKRNFNEWFTVQRGMKSPLKHMQLKAAQVLLQYCQTTSVRRLEWENRPKNEN